MAFPVDEQRVEVAEAELGRRLPAPLRERLMRDNGGEISVAFRDADDLDPGWELHPVWDDGDRRRMARTASHIVRETAEAREWPAFPARAIPFAANGTGDRLVIAAGSDDLLHWDHETGQTTRVRVDWS